MALERRHPARMHERDSGGRLRPAESKISNRTAGASCTALHMRGAGDEGQIHISVDTAISGRQPSRHQIRPTSKSVVVRKVDR
jgi:hypothetical protein